MKKFKIISRYLYIVFIALILPCSFANGQSLPALQKQGTATQLIVGGKPYLMLAGELHNSSCSNVEYMNAIWPRMKQLNLNTVIAPASWELIESQEGKYDFALVDAMLQGARKSELKIVLIWFASWKNGGSTYMPSWVKKDHKRFPRVVDQNGNSIEILSTLGEESMKADGKAFAALMNHIHEVDKDNIVLMVQVENEAGVLGPIRDFSTIANKAFYGPVPNDLILYLQKNKNNLTPELNKVWKQNGFKTSGNWEEIFGKSFLNEKDWKSLSFYTEELFMAYNYAKYIGYVANQGKKEHNIPMFVNAWLKGPDYPWTGRFPGGGPLPQVMDMWRTAAPSIDFLTPDIYVPFFKQVLEQYDQLGNPMFIPETRGGAIGASRVLFAIGEHNIMGFSPFGIDGKRDGNDDPQSNPLVHTYALLDGMSELILQNQGKGTMRGILVDDETPIHTFELGNYTVTANARNRPPEETTSGGLIIMLGSDEYIVLGRNLNVFFTPKVPGELPLVGVDKIYEGEFNSGKWTSGRLLNGDETHCTIVNAVSPPGTGLKMSGISIQKISLYRYK